MKNTIKNNLLFAALFTVLFSFANENPSFLKENKAKESYVTFNNVKKGSLLRLKDASNKIIYKEEIKVSGQYIKKFDFTFLPSGNYYFELEKDLAINTKPFKVNTNSITFDDKKATDFFKPIVTLKGSKLLISQLSLNKQPLKLKLFYENGIGDFDEIYNQTLSGNIILESILKLSEKRKGQYKIVLYSENHMFVEVFNLQ